MISIDIYRATRGMFYLNLGQKQYVRNFFFDFIRLVLCSILIQIVNRNLHYGLVRATKLTCEGVENNLGSTNYAIKKTMQASHHQGYVRYGRSTGMQCTETIQRVKEAIGPFLHVPVLALQ